MYVCIYLYVYVYIYHVSTHPYSIVSATFEKEKKARSNISNGLVILWAQEPTLPTLMNNSSWLGSYYIIL